MLSATSCARTALFSVVTMWFVRRPGTSVNGLPMKTDAPRLPYEASNARHRQIAWPKSPVLVMNLFAPDQHGQFDAGLGRLDLPPQKAVSG